MEEHPAADLQKTDLPKSDLPKSDLPKTDLSGTALPEAALPETVPEVRISVRTLVEFLLRSGDIEAGEGAGVSTEAMQMGSRLHRKLQKAAGAEYQAEVPLSVTSPVRDGDLVIRVTVEGRADGIFFEDGKPVIDEIKGVYRDVGDILEPLPVHRAQALCYAWFYAAEHKPAEIGIRITYCSIPTEEIRYLEETLTFDELAAWYAELMEQYRR